MTEHTNTPPGARYIDAEGRVVMTDGGAAAAMNAGEQANVSPASQMVGGRGFQQLVAQSDLAAASEGTRRHEMAANAVREFRGQAQLEKDEWKTLDENLVQIAQENLVMVNDLRQAGLVMNEDLSTLIHEWQTTNDFGDANVSMGAETTDSEDASTFALNGVPLPIVDKSFRIPYRKLLASRNRGLGLDTQNQSKAARSVMEGLEDIVANGWGGQVENYEVYGYTNHPDINSLGAGSDWTAGGTGADTIRGEVLDLVEANEDANYGPEGPGYWMYMARDVWQGVRRKDTGTDQERGLLERLEEEFDYISYRRADRLDDGTAILVKPVEDVVELAVAADVQNVEWQSNDGFTTHLKVMASMTPVVKSDDDGNSGIAVYTGLSS